MTKIKCQKPAIKVVRDLLTKKWVFVKRNKQLSAMSLCLSNLPPPIRDIQAPVMPKGGEKQLTGYESINAQTNFKISLVPPFSPSSARNHSPTMKLWLYFHSYLQRKVGTHSKNSGFMPGTVYKGVGHFFLSLAYPSSKLISLVQC
jgi:hypothetical protein